MNKKKILKLLPFIGIPLIYNRLTKNYSESNHHEEQYFNFAFGKIRYLKKGSGRPILLIHDTKPTSGLFEFEKAIDLLQRNYTVYAIDLLGFGASSKPAITYSNYLYVTLIKEFVRKVIKEKTYVAACGNSAAYTLLAHTFDKSLFEKMILISPNILNFNKPSIFNKIMCKIFEMPIYGSFFYNISNSIMAIKIKSILKTQVHSKYFEHNMFFYSHFNVKNAKYSNAYANFKFSNIDLLLNRDNLDLKVHVIWGLKDMNNPISNYNKILTHYKEFGLTTFDQSRSIVHFENPTDFYKVCKMFFNEK